MPPGVNCYAHSHAHLPEDCPQKKRIVIKNIYTLEIDLVMHSF